MALDESVDNLESIDSNGVVAYIDPGLKKSLAQFGEINIDYITNQAGQSGFTIKAGDPNAACGTCGDKSPDCG
jgi:Fe-S cluster assembly iron-binding protein IscA